MKFRFLGGMDCPDWLLTQICSNFAKFTSLKFRTLCQQAAASIIDGKVDESALKKCEDDRNRLSDIYTTVSLIGEWLLEKPAGYECSADNLQNEMIQLGLPLEHSKMLHKVYTSSVEKLKEKVISSTFKEPHAEVLSCDSSTNIVKLKIRKTVYEVSTTTSQLNTLKSDLRCALTEMDKLIELLPRKSG